MSLAPQLLQVIACPEDHGTLWYFDDEAVLYNPRLKKKYRVENDVPVLLLSEAAAASPAEHERLSELFQTQSNQA